MCLKSEGYEIIDENSTHRASGGTGVAAFTHDTYLCTTHPEMCGPPGRGGTGSLLPREAQAD